MEQTKLFKEMTADEQLHFVADLRTYASEKLPLLEQLGDTWEACNVKSMKDGLALLAAFRFARDFVDKTLHYGDFAARVKRLRFYFELIEKKIAAGEGVNGTRGDTFAIVPPIAKTTRRGRPASAATIARREAEAKAAKQQTEIFDGTQNGDSPRVTSSTVTQGTVPTVSPFIAPTTRDDLEYKLSIAQKRAFLSPTLQPLADQIRALRTTAGAAAEKAKTMADLKASPEMIAPVAEEAQRTLEQVEAIYADIDQELAVTWYRLQNDSPEWREAWMKRYGFKSYDDLHPDLIHDLRKHYKKVSDAQPDFDHRMKTLIEQESPEYIEKQKAEAEKKKEVQAILRYFQRKDKGKSVETARTKFARLQELLGKKEAANYRPLLTKIEEEAKEAERAKKPTKKG